MIAALYTKLLYPRDLTHESTNMWAALCTVFYIQNSLISKIVCFYLNQIYSPQAAHVCQIPSLKSLVVLLSGYIIKGHHKQSQRLATRLHPETDLASQNCRFINISEYFDIMRLGL